jgi:uncharacterized protein YegP (UPF0339 family)
MRIPKLEVRQTPTTGLYNLFLVAANGEALMHGLQGYSRRNVKRAIKRIKSAMADAEVVFVPGAGDVGDYVVGLGDQT